MGKIESLIFNELASHRAVALPRVGTLRVVRRHAHSDGGELRAPENRVVYSLETDGDTPTVTWLGVDEHEYLQWLEVAMKDDELTIEGVGTLVLGEFVPSPELEQALNPESTPEHHEPQPEACSIPLQTDPHREVAPSILASANHALTHHHDAPRRKKRTHKNDNRVTNILLIVAIALLLALLGLYLWRTFCHGRDEVELTTRVQVEEPVIQPVARYRRNFPNLAVTTLDNGSGRTLVSVFKGTTEHEAYNRFYKIAEQTGNWEMWVYHVPAGGNN